MNLPHELTTKVWHNPPLGLAFVLGEKDEGFGSDLSRLQGPTYEQGYLPIVRTRYHFGDSTIEEEAFAPVEAPLGLQGRHDHVRLRVAQEPEEGAGRGVGPDGTQGANGCAPQGHVVAGLGQGRQVRAGVGTAQEP